MKKKNNMLSLRKLRFVIIITIVSVLFLQGSWLFYLYDISSQQLMTDLRVALGQAYKKEQTYRIPIVDIVSPGAVTIESCGMEEVQIIRKCPTSDTIVYNNPSGLSIESFISNVFVDLREHIVPMNIFCLADLFAGILHDNDIPVYFVIERFNILSGEVTDSSLLPGKKQPQKSRTIITMDISEKEAIRAIVELKPTVVFGQILGALIFTICLNVVIIICLVLIYRFTIVWMNIKDSEESLVKTAVVYDNIISGLELYDKTNSDSIYSIGQYVFDSAKNELQGFGESIQLNKKENAILCALCSQRGNIVVRSALLEENWGNNGFIYSRSLDTYITVLRKYLKKDSSIQIVTIKGVGYKLKTDNRQLYSTNN